MRTTAVLRAFDPKLCYYRYTDPVERVRARILTYLLLATVPLTLTVFVLITTAQKVPLVLEIAAPVAAVLFLSALRRGIGPARIGLAYGLFMDAVFLEAIIRTGSEVAYLWLAFVPFIIVFISGRRVASFLLIPSLLSTVGAVLLAHAAPHAIPHLTAMFGESIVYSDILAFLTFVLVLFFGAVSLEGLALGLYNSYSVERAEVESEIRTRIEKEEALANSLHLLEAVFAAIPLPVFIKDRELRFVWCSAAFLELLGKTAVEVNGRTVTDLYESEVAEVHAEADRRLLETGRVQYYPSKVVRYDGTVRDGITLKTPLRDPIGSVTGMVGVFEDQTDRIEGEKRLLALLENRRDALALLGHDLRNPIGSFRALVRSMHDDEHIDPAEYREVLEELGRSLDSLWRLLDELLDWARADAGLADFHPGWFSVAEMASSTSELLVERAREKHIRYETRIDGDLKCWGDERMVATILRNLVANALKFTPTGGSVLVTAERVAGGEGASRGTRFVVADTGIGMSDSYLGSLFGVEASRSRHGTDGEPGTGLGLRLCRGLAERHGGGISVESVERAGTVFSVFLPEPT